MTIQLLYYPALVYNLVYNHNIIAILNINNAINV
jgi:hypothetical protein